MPGDEDGNNESGWCLSFTYHTTRRVLDMALHSHRYTFSPLFFFADDACVSPRPTLALPDDQLTDTQFARHIDYLVGDQIGGESFDDAEPRSGHQDGKSDDKDEEARAERNDRDQHIINSSIDTGTRK